MVEATLNFFKNIYTYPYKFAFYYIKHLLREGLKDVLRIKRVNGRVISRNFLKFDLATLRRDLKDIKKTFSNPYLYKIFDVQYMHWLAQTDVK